MLKALGKKPVGKWLHRAINSGHYHNHKFTNVEFTSVNPNNVSLFKMFKDFSNRPKSVSPAGEIPTIKTDLNHLHFENPVIVWFGHSSYLISSRGFNILVDPVLSGHASPIKAFGKAFRGADIYKPADLPEIDLLIITHDHYDHLDFETVSSIRHKVKQVVTSLGVGSHLRYWGYDPSKIIELDWWEHAYVSDSIEITATPARHFSGRLFKRDRTLWTSYVLKLHGFKIFLGGDSGYDKQFKAIGERFHGFDLAMLECGQYGKDWPQIHMFPEEVITAAKDLEAEVIMPVHWSKFVLSVHPWNEPIQRLQAEAVKQQQAFVSPLIGQPYETGKPFLQQLWWDFE